MKKLFKAIFTLKNQIELEQVVSDQIEEIKLLRETTEKMQEEITQLIKAEAEFGCESQFPRRVDRNFTLGD